MGRERRNVNKIDGQFVGLPYHVVNSTGFQALEHASRTFLIYLATQYNGKNNGRLVAGMTWAVKFGYKSNNGITRAVADLERNGLLFCTRKGARPNKASWYMLTWRRLDWTADMDIKLGDAPNAPYLNPTNITTLTPLVGKWKA